MGPLPPAGKGKVVCFLAPGKGPAVMETGHTAAGWICWFGLLCFGIGELFYLVGWLVPGWSGTHYVPGLLWPLEWQNFPVVCYPTGMWVGMFEGAISRLTLNPFRWKPNLSEVMRDGEGGRFQSQ